MPNLLKFGTNNLITESFTLFENQFLRRQVTGEPAEIKDFKMVLAKDNKNWQRKAH